MCNTQYQGCEINLSQLKLSAVPEAKSVCVAAGKQARVFDQMCMLKLVSGNSCKNLLFQQERPSHKGSK
jgi:hypothetical protein